MKSEHWRNAVYWLLGYAFFWYLLTGGAGWIFALPVLLLATFVAGRLRLRPLRLRLLQLPGFVGFFLKTMASGAWDVARRAWHPRRPVQPAWVSHPLRLRDPLAQQICSALVGLLPGTLVAYIHEDQVRMHLLDEQQGFQETLGSLERHLERLLILESPPC